MNDYTLSKEKRAEQEKFHRALRDKRFERYQQGGLQALLNGPIKKK